LETIVARSFNDTRGAKCVKHSALRKEKSVRATRCTSRVITALEGEIGRGISTRPQVLSDVAVPKHIFGENLKGQAPARETRELTRNF
jgi:hypothetical protein